MNKIQSLFFFSSKEVNTELCYRSELPLMGNVDGDIVPACMGIFHVLGETDITIILMYVYLKTSILKQFYKVCNRVI